METLKKLIKVKWYVFLMSLTPKDVHSYVINGAIKEAIRERDGVKYHLVWEKVADK